MKTKNIYRIKSALMIGKESSQEHIDESGCRG